ncbi:MAG: GAF domain-containing protein [Thalassotalea sp.]
MNKDNSAFCEKQLLEEIQYLQKTSDLEQGRNNVLRMAAQGAALDAILDVLCQKAQLYNDEMLCSILQLNHDTNTLHTIAAKTLPLSYSNAINGVSIGSSVGSCGTAAFKKERVIVENINTHPYWNQYKSLALTAGLQACWSEPIIGSEGKVFGTFAMYYREPKAPTAEDLQFIEVSANLAAVVFENHDTRQKLIKANNALNNTIDQRTTELELANSDLEQLIKQQNTDHVKNIISEKKQTTKSLVVGFANRVNPPISIALTAIGVANQQLIKLKQATESNKLTRSELEKTTALIAESIQLSYKKLIITSDLLEQFNSLNTEEYDHQTTFNLNSLFNELQEGLIKLLGHSTITFEAEDINLTCNKDALWQVFYQLIENSVLHGFKGRKHGKILITATQLNNNIIINYQDDGCGIEQQYTASIFDPFFTVESNQGHNGLGLSTIVSLLETSLAGEIKYIDSPIGARFEITMNCLP